MKDNSGKIILALLAGASAGIVAGLLMVPDSGTVSRGNLKNYAGKLSKDLEKTFQDSLSKIDTNAILGAIGLGGKGGNAGGDDAGGSAAGAGTSGAAGRRAGGAGVADAGAGAEGAGGSATGEQGHS
jgi:hypothetical protein